MSVWWGGGPKLDSVVKKSLSEKVTFNWRLKG